LLLSLSQHIDNDAGGGVMLGLGGHWRRARWGWTFHHWTMLGVLVLWKVTVVAIAAR